MLEFCRKIFYSCETCGSGTGAFVGFSVIVTGNALVKVPFGQRVYYSDVLSF